MIIADNMKDTNGREGLHNISFKYLHGEIEEINGYDICYSHCEDEANVLNSETGIYDVAVRVEKESEDKLLRIKSTFTTYECKAYIWPMNNFEISKKRGLTHGLIVLKSNKEDNEFALNKYNNRATMI